MSDIEYLDNQYVMFGDIDDKEAAQFVSFLIEHHQQPDRVEEIVLHLKTDGGIVSAGFAIIDAMQMSTIPIKVIGMGFIASMGVLILSAGDTRHLTRNAEVMAHQFYNEVEGNYTQVKREVAQYERMYVQFVNHFLETTKMNIEDIEKYVLAGHDMYLTPKQCVELGICDEILKPIRK